MSNPLVVYVDVDDTLVRTIGSRHAPIPVVIAHVQELFRAGVELYCWSTAGQRYAEDTARALGIHHCFRAFLPKPHVVLDDEDMSSWRKVVHQHPLNCYGVTAEDYRRLVHGK